MKNMKDTKKKVKPPIDSSIESPIWEKMRTQHLPIHGSIELTRRCNLKCPYCYLRFARNTPPEDELSREEIFSLFDQFAGEGCVFLTFTGGEPLALDDFHTIYLNALRKGFLVTIFTNGTLIDREMADFFARYPPFHIDITVFGATEKTYEQVSGVKGSYRQSQTAIQLLSQKKIPFGLKSVINTLNHHEIGEMKTQAGDLGQIFRFDSLICPQLNGSREGIQHRLSPEEIVRTDRRDKDRWEEWVEFACRDRASAGDRRLYRCGGGLYSFHVNSSGRLSICTLDTNYQYDLKKGTFHEGWHTFIPRIRAIQANEKSVCGNCKLSSICTVCPAWSKMETGEPDRSVEFLCQIARLRGILFEEYRRNSHEKEKTLPSAASNVR